MTTTAATSPVRKSSPVVGTALPGARAGRDLRAGWPGSRGSSHRRRSQADRRRWRRAGLPRSRSGGRTTAARRHQGGRLCTPEMCGGAAGTSPGGRWSRRWRGCRVDPTSAGPRPRCRLSGTDGAGGLDLLRGRAGQSRIVVQWLPAHCVSRDGHQGQLASRAAPAPVVVAPRGKAAKPIPCGRVAFA
jgi:hypothetical protein